LVLDTLQAVFGEDKVFYWRDKADHEIDFVIPKSRNNVIAVECKINPDKFQPKNLSTFRSQYPQGENWVLSPRIKTAYTQKFETMKVVFLPLSCLSAL